MSTRQDSWSALRTAVLGDMAAQGFDTPEDLHRASGVSGNTIRSFLDGGNQPYLSTLRKMTMPLGWDPTWPRMILRDGVSLRALRLARGDKVEPDGPRDPATHSLAESTDAEIEAEVRRRRETR